MAKIWPLTPRSGAGVCSADIVSVALFARPINASSILPASGRFKSFLIEQDESLLNVLRYVERNALRANLVERAQDWRWCSIWRKLNGDRESQLCTWPLDMPADWVDWVNAAQTVVELEALRKSVNRGTPYRSEAGRRGSRMRSGWNLLFIRAADL